MTNKQQFIKALKVLMIVSGFWKKPLTNYYILNKMYNFYFIYSKLIVLVFCIDLAMGLAKLIKNGVDKEIIISAISVTITCNAILTKTYICIKRRLIETLDEIEKYEEDIWKSDNEKIKNVYNTKARFSNNMCIGQALIQLLTLVTMLYIGLNGDQKQIAFNTANNVRIDSYYWYQIWFPAFKLDHLVWVYMLNLIYGFSGCLANIVTHSIVTTLMIFATVQLEILNIKLRNFIKNENDNLKNKTNELKQYVKQHQDLISYVKILNNNIKIIVLMHFILNSIEISSCVTGLLKDSLPSEKIFMLSYMSLVTYQLFMTSWNANEIIEQSIAIADAIYVSNWHLLDKEGKIICNIIIQRAQKPLIVTIGPFGPMTNQSGLLVMKAAYSYVSLMNGGIH